jgi:hypothetical protein
VFHSLYCSHHAIIIQDQPGPSLSCCRIACVSNVPAFSVAQHGNSDS